MIGARWRPAGVQGAQEERWHRTNFVYGTE